ncbi:transcription factor 12 isoform X2 [Hydra vulgaris]|uniref:Transcription factor E2-alpha n=2 Tax=Hydra vulgaris TaxID=6087 RepID=T2MGD1_HYDVU|nr:transcription factor 12 isoform X1 [Hydra vulgaris]
MSQRDGPMADWLNTWDRNSSSASSTHSENVRFPSNSSTRMALNNDKELSDLLDFSAMFTPPNHTNNRPTVDSTLQSSGPVTAVSRPDGDESWTTYEARPFDGGASGVIFVQDDGELMLNSRKGLSANSFSPAIKRDAFSMMLINEGQNISYTRAVSPTDNVESTEWRRYKQQQKSSAARSVYSPTSEDIIPGDPSLPYSSPKGGIYGNDYYLEHGSPDPWGHHMTSVRPHTMTGPYSTLPPEFYSTMELSDSRLPPSLPPMSSFRQHGSSSLNTSSSQFVATSSYNDTLPRGNESTHCTSQPGESLGKALASMYSNETNSTASFPSNPSSPVASPPPLISNRTNAPLSTNTNPASFDNIQQMNRMQETLDDAIWVLKNHAESSLTRPYIHTRYPPTLTDQLQNAPIDSPIDNSINSHISTPQNLLEIGKKKNKGESKAKKRHKLDDSDIIEMSGDDDSEPKYLRESERRHANNARERVRVRDINEAFKELGRMCSLHLKNENPQTKLTVLHQAVTIINSLESQVRERNLNPKAACLKRRGDEEKLGDDVSDKRISLGGLIDKRNQRRPQQSINYQQSPLDGSGMMQDTGIFSH